LARSPRGIHGLFQISQRLTSSSNDPLTGVFGERNYLTE
jgi:hypothetical protein